MSNATPSPSEDRDTRLYVEDMLAPEVPWRKIVGTRNRLMHAYLGIDMTTVWSIVSRELPDLRHSLAELLKRI